MKETEDARKQTIPSINQYISHLVFEKYYRERHGLDTIDDYDHGIPELTEHLIKLHIDPSVEASERKKQTTMFFNAEIPTD